ncbi:MAG: alpha/beta hydrolase [Bacteroidota bacterium]
MKEKLLLLHGALGSKKQFDRLKQKLEASFDVHAMNFEGHGGSASSNEFSIELFTQNVMDYLEANAMETITIFGYSMGGYVGLNAALKIPKKINKIITLGTKFQWDIESAEKETKMLNPIKIEEKVPAFAEKLKQEHHPEDWKVVMNKTAEMMIEMAKGAKIKDSDFKNINQTVIIGIGSLDHMVSYEESAYVSELLPNSKLVELEGVKHPIDTVGTNELLDYITSN